MEWIEDEELWPKLLHPDDRARAIAENERHNETGEPFRMEYRLFHRDGHIVWVHDEARMVRDDRGVPRFSHGVMMDISDRKRGEENVAFLAYHDELTGLPSRSMFDELLELSISRARRHDGAVAVIAVDVDDFRLVNDSLGHTGGDEVLRVVADRLREASRETDLVARRGGDQFLMLIADLERDAGGEMEGAVVRAEAAAQRVQDAMLAPITIERHGALRLGQHGHQPVPAGCRRRQRPPAQRRGRDVRVEEERSCGVRGLVERGLRLEREAAVRHPTSQGGRHASAGRCTTSQ